MPGRLRVEVDDREFREANRNLARRNKRTLSEQANRTMYFTTLRTYKRTKAADESDIRQYFNQKGTLIGKITKKGVFKRLKSTKRFTFGKRSIAVLMALKMLRAGGRKITRSSVQTLASRIVAKALKAIGYFKAGWVDIGKRAARGAGSGVFPFGLGKVPFIRVRNKYQAATTSRDTAELTYRTKARAKGTKKRRTFIKEEIVNEFDKQFNRSANEEIEKVNKNIRKDARKSGL